MGVPLQRERDLNTAARIGRSLVKQNSVLMEENSKLEAMLGSAREEVPGCQGRNQEGAYLRPASISLCQDLCLPLSAPRTQALLPLARFYISGTR